MPEVLDFLMTKKGCEYMYSFANMALLANVVIRPSNMDLNVGSAEEKSACWL